MNSIYLIFNSIISMICIWIALLMTVPTNLSEYHNPFIVLELLLNLPMECHMGIICDNLKPMIDAAIREQTKSEKQQNIIIEEQIKRIQQTKQQIDEYKQPNLLPAAPLAIPPTANINQNIIQKRDDYIIQPLQRRPSLKQFESVLKEGYTFNLIQALLGAFLSGCNIAVLNVPSLVIQNECNLNMNKYSSLQTFYCLGGLIDALSIGKISDTFGRKHAIIIFDIMFIISGLLLFGFAETYYSIFLIGRLICGIGSGISTTIIPIYLGEISPSLIRGAIGTLNQLTVAFGLIIAELLSYHKKFGNKKLWKYLFIINIILPIIQFFTLWTLPESPKWVITKNDENEARKILQYLRECSNANMDLHFTKLMNFRIQLKKLLLIMDPLIIQVIQINNQFIHGYVYIH